MNRITATTLALAMMIGGAGGALAQGTTAPATNNAPAATAPATPAAPAAQMPAKKVMKKAPHKMTRSTTHRTMRRAARTTPLDNRATQALNLLAANGYTGVSDFKVDGKQFTATATQNGKSVPVTIDVDAKTVKAGS